MAQMNCKSQGLEPTACADGKGSALLLQNRDLTLAMQTGLSWNPSCEGFRVGLEEGRPTQAFL